MFRRFALAALVTALVMAVWMFGGMIGSAVGFVAGALSSPLALLGPLLPLAALAVLGALAWRWWKGRNKGQGQTAAPLAAPLVYHGGGNATATNAVHISIGRS